MHAMDPKGNRRGPGQEPCEAGGYSPARSAAIGAVMVPETLAAGQSQVMVTGPSEGNRPINQ